jgi:hypothetical protein
MNPMNKDTEQAIRKINNSFYNAFEGLSLEKMEELWKHGDDHDGRLESHARRHNEINNIIYH